MRIVLLCLAFVFAATSFAAAAPVLERVVMVSRHGVRSPIKTVDALNALTKRGWAAWPVAAGEMTDHGAKDLAIMADDLRATYAAKGVLPASGCPAPGALEVWADARDHRTRQSGDIWADRLAPGCKVVSRFKDGGDDALFDSGKSNACPIGLLTRAGALIAATRDTNGTLLTPADRHALQTLQGILAPDACNKLTLGICMVPETDASSATSVADLSLGATIAEGLYLEYEQGFPPAEVGWGKAASPETIATVMPVHEHGIDILRRTPQMAARRGAVLARTIVALLHGKPLPPDAPKLAPDAKVVMLAGHDSNLLYLAGILGLDWRLPDQPSVTAPDTTMAFELWHDPATDKRTVKVVIYAQTLGQLRDATPLDAEHRPDVVPVVPEVCGKDGDCALASFGAGVEQRLAKLCGG